jgi:hypothetical protein
LDTAPHVPDDKQPTRIAQLIIRELRLFMFTAKALDESRYHAQIIPLPLRSVFLIPALPIGPGITARLDNGRNITSA